MAVSCAQFRFRFPFATAQIKRVADMLFGARLFCTKTRYASLDYNEPITKKILTAISQIT